MSSADRQGVPEADKKSLSARLRDTLLISRDFGILVMAMVVIGLGFGLIAPIIPDLALRLGASVGEMGGMFALFFVTYVIAMPPSGYLADVVGRKKMLVAGIFVFGVTTLLLAFIESKYEFALLRAVEGVGAAMVAPAAFALVVDLVPEEKRATAMGVQGTAQLLGILAGPALGGFLAGQIDFYYPFYVGGALSFACAAIVWIVREPSTYKEVERASLLTMFGAWKRSASQNRSLSALTVRGFVMGIVQGLWNLGLILFWRERIAMDLTEVGLAMTVGVSVMAVGTAYFGTLADKYGKLPFTIAGGAIMASGLGAMSLASDVIHVYVLVALMDFGAAMSNPSVMALLADNMSKEERGRVMGAYQTVQGIGNIVGFTALGYVYDHVSPEAPIVMCAAALAIATTIIAAFVKEKPRGTMDGGPDARREVPGETQDAHDQAGDA